MSEFLDKLIASQRIVDWIGPKEDRFSQATSSKDADRFGWFEDKANWPLLAIEVKRLIVPLVFADSISMEVDGDPDWQSVFLHVPNMETWSQIFPVSEQMHIFTRQDRRAWACIALTDVRLGLGVFGIESADNRIEAQVQLVPEEISEKL